jgi:hypothetical protein
MAVSILSYSIFLRRDPRYSRKYVIASVENPAIKVGAMEDFSAKTAVVKVNAEATDGRDRKREWAITIHK